MKICYRKQKDNTGSQKKGRTSDFFATKCLQELYDHPSTTKNCRHTIKTNFTLIVSGLKVNYNWFDGSMSSATQKLRVGKGYHIAVSFHVGGFAHLLDIQQSGLAV